MSRSQRALWETIRRACLMVASAIEKFLQDESEQDRDRHAA